jgi:superfamily II DNA/RNA helicase
MNNFDSLPLPAALRASLAAMQFTSPTPIQAQTIPLALEGRDILGSAQTGTGKTAAFAIPLVTKLLNSPRGIALVMTPTRELATQVNEVIEQLLGKRSLIRTALLIGGESMPAQIQQLRSRPRVIVGTPGRINDHLERGTLMLHETGILVLDETDRMLDMGFSIQIERIMKFVPQGRQTLMFSATMPPAIISIAQKYLNNPERIAVGSTTAPVVNIEQETVHVAQEEKYNRLLAELDKRQGSIIVFVKTKHGAKRLAERLCKEKHRADAIHGNLHQNKRERVIDAFREQRYRIMVATDIAARGLDIHHIEHVINYDLPQVPEDYIHRIGRTARAGASGSAINLISPDDARKWREITRLLNPQATPSSASGHHGSNGNSSRGNGNNNGNANKHRKRRRWSSAPRTERAPQKMSSAAN